PFGGDGLEAGAQEFRGLVGARDARGVDVPDAGSGLARVAVGGEFVGDLHTGAGRLQADDVGVEVVDGLDDVAELGVAHVGVDLGVRADAGRGEPEGFGGPVQVFGPVGAA